MQAVVQDLLTTYLRQGNGKQILVLHGWGDSSVGWREFATELAKKYEVIVPDLPGFGGSQAPKKTWGLEEYAQFVRNFIEKLNLKPYVVLGHSNGGSIAIHALANDIFTAEKLVLLASAGIRGERSGRTTVIKAVAKTGKFLARPLPTRTQQKLRDKMYKTAGSDLLVAEHLQESFRKIITEDVRADAAKLTVPSLLIYGEQDDQTPVRYGRLFHEIINGSTLEIIPADHFLHQSHQATVVKLVEEFVQ